MAIDPRVDAKICTGCNVRRSCARTTGMPPCAKQFFEPAAQSGEAPVQHTQPAITLADLLPILNKHLQGRVVRDIFNDIPQQLAGA